VGKDAVASSAAAGLATTPRTAPEEGGAVIIALSAADAERLRTWALEIVDTLLPETRHRDEGDARKYLGIGGLSINKRSGAWFSHSAGKGGYSTVGLMAFVKAWEYAEAIAWARVWLASHAGIGSCDGDSSGDTGEATRASAAQAREILANMVDAAGTPGEVYLRSRRLDPPFPATAFLANARCGEVALVAILTSHERTVGIQLLYIDPDGRALWRRCGAA